jgi:NADH-quinone oxidoreductase subunit J
MLLIVSFGALAGLYVLHDSPFTAVTQIIVYAGAIMVLFLFVVMLLNQHTEDDIEAMPARFKGLNLRAGVLLSLMLAIEVAWGLSKVGVTTFSTDAGAVASISSVARIGTALFTTHSFAFEVTSVLILVSMVGAVVIARREH